VTRQNLLEVHSIYAIILEEVSPNMCLFYFVSLLLTVEKSSVRNYLPDVYSQTASLHLK